MGRGICISKRHPPFYKCGCTAHLDTHPTVIRSGVYHQSFAAASESGSGKDEPSNLKCLCGTLPMCRSTRLGQRRKQPHAEIVPTDFIRIGEFRPIRVGGIICIQCYAKI